MKLSGFSHAFCFGSWTLTLMLHIMEDYLISGCDLELYSHEELQFVFWYLHDVLYHCEIQTILRADATARENDVALQNYIEVSQISPSYTDRQHTEFTLGRIAFE